MVSIEKAAKSQSPFLELPSQPMPILQVELWLCFQALEKAPWFDVFFFKMVDAPFIYIYREREREQFLVGVDLCRY